MRKTITSTLLSRSPTTNNWSTHLSSVYLIMHMNHTQHNSIFLWYQSHDIFLEEIVLIIIIENINLQSPFFVSIFFPIYFSFFSWKKFNSFFNILNNVGRELTFHSIYLLTSMCKVPIVIYSCTSYKIGKNFLKFYGVSS